ncbi:MAG: hypothetical protein O3A33_14265 [Chloroflexi bacterium]|nr:hypothetical protein [Chloroflexota bacterium]
MTNSENRAIAGRFQKGESGNPGGRPKGLGSYVRDKTGDGQDIVDFYLSVFDGTYRIGKTSPSLNHRMQAADWLADRGFGKVLQERVISGHVLHEGVSLDDISKLSRQQRAETLEAAAAILRQRDRDAAYATVDGSFRELAPQ